MEAEPGAGFRSGLVTITGRPNVGKSTLLNRILDHKVSIVSDKPQTTRSAIRGILNRSDAQVVFVDTPGIHKPRTPLGERLNRRATGSLSGVDLTLFLIDATAPFGRGDRFIAERLSPDETVLVVNKVDAARPAEIARQLAAAGGLGFAEYFAVSARTGDGVAALVAGVVDRLPEGPAYYPSGVVSDVPDAFWVAELVREQLLAIVHDELPHSIATRVTEWDWPRIRCEILVERDSQKGIVIGRDGGVLKRVGTEVRRQLPPGAFLELAVKVEKDWQHRPDALRRLGLD
jgi:GTP-binding protein Era